MIGQICGIILEKKPPYLLVDVGGIGYEVSAPMTTFYHLPDIQQKTTLHTHLIVREDAHTLYGFHHPRDRRLFRALIKVNGVGPKLALTILSGIEPDHFVRCILQKDISSLISIPGIGKKTAERLMIETKDALSSWHSSTQIQESTTNSDQTVQDAISALVALGYKSNDANRTVMQLQQPDLSSEQMIRLALKNMVDGGK